MPRFLKIDFQGDPNIGLHGLATDRFCLLPRNVPQDKLEKIKDVLQVPVIQLGLYGTDLLGIFAVANSSAMLISDIVFDNELEELRQKLKPFGIKIHIIKTEHTALGNNILLNDKAGIISRVFDKKATAQIKKAFPKVEFMQSDVADTSVPGSAGFVTNKGGVFNQNISDGDIKKIEKLFGFEIGLGTVNFGNPFVSSAIIANSNGALIGSLSSGFEVSRVFESLGFS